MAEPTPPPRYVKPGWFTQHVFNPTIALFTRMGLSVWGSRELRVRGRKSGEWRTNPVNLLTLDGTEYLVAPRGTTQWVRNLRVAGTGELRVGRRVQAFRATELSDADKVPVLRAYLLRWKAEVGAFFDGVDGKASDAELLAIAPDHPAFRIDNGLVLDKNGNKMSKRLGNSVDPFETLETYGADATRWYMMVNSQPWDNLKFDTNGIDEVRRNLGTLFNTYSFYALYANIDGFKYAEQDIPHDKRPEIDRWILSLLNSLVQDVDGFYADYEPTKATRAIQNFVVDHLSNWYVRLCRRRFWKGEYGEDKVSAYQTLYTCLETICLLMAPVAPMLPEALFRALNAASGKHPAESVHLADFPVTDSKIIDKDLEERMQLAQDISSMVLSLRKKENIKVRQPLAKIMIPVLDKHFEKQLKAVEDLIKSEVNVKEVEYLQDTAGVIVKKVKPDFKQLGKKLGPKMKALQAALGNFTQEDIVRLEAEGYYDFDLEGETVRIDKSELEITSEDIPGWLVANEGELTVALDITITDDLQNEGNARELVNRIQRLRKDKDFNVTDRIKVTIESNSALSGALKDYKDYICSEILAVELIETERLVTADTIDINDIPVKVHLQTV